MSSGAVRSTSIESLVDAWDRVTLRNQIVDANLRDVFPAQASDPQFVEMLHASVDENVTFLQAVMRDTDVALSPPGRAAVALGALEADLGLSQERLQRSYRTGLRTAWQSWVALVLERVPLAQQPEMLIRGADVVHSRLDSMVGGAVIGYTERELQLRKTGVELRRRYVTGLLRGEEPESPDESYRALLYDLTADHLAVLLTETSPSDVSSIAHRLRAVSGAMSSLETRIESATTIVWLSQPTHTGWTAALHQRIRGALEESGSLAAVSGPATGTAGFRSTYDDALRVERVRRALPGPPAVLTLDAVRLEILLLSDETRARAFAEAELRALAGPGERTARLRETVLIALTSRTYQETAEFLGLHEHTVRNRVQRAEALLGRSLSEGAAEIQVALRLHRVLVPDTDVGTDRGRPALRSNRIPHSSPPEHRT